MNVEEIKKREIEKSKLMDEITNVRSKITKIMKPELIEERKESPNYYNRYLY